jgi:hypothetical protein
MPTKNHKESDSCSLGNLKIIPLPGLLPLLPGSLLSLWESFRFTPTERLPPWRCAAAYPCLRWGIY